MVQQDLDLPEVVIQNPPVLTCDDPEITLTSTGTMSGPGITYEWVTTGGNIIGTNNNEEVVLDQAGFYQLVVTNANNGCINSMEVLFPSTPLLRWRMQGKTWNSIAWAPHCS